MKNIEIETAVPDQPEQDETMVRDDIRQRVLDVLANWPTERMKSFADELEQQSRGRGDEAGTGIPRLDYYLDRMTREEIVAAFVIAEAVSTGSEVGVKVRDYLWRQVRPLDSQPETVVSLCETEGVPGDAAIIEWWLEFWRGTIKGEQPARETV